jgi:hypothetical protein
LFLPVLLLGCSFREHPYWIEAHGHATVHDVTPSALGVYAIAMDDRLLRYPGEYGNPWAFESQGGLAKVAGKGDLLMAVERDGSLAWVKPNRGKVSHSEAWQLSGVSVGGHERVFVIAAGHTRKLAQEQLEDTACSALPAQSIAATVARVWVVSGGALHVDDGRACTPVVGAPARIASVAANDTLVGVVTEDGAAMIRGKDGWSTLPAPRKRRVDTMPRVTRIQRLALGLTTTHALDHEGSVFLLSEQPL